MGRPMTIAMARCAPETNRGKSMISCTNNVYGGAVNIASRISGLSAPGEVLVSDTVRSLARTSAGATFEDRGEQALKGVGEKVRVWAVHENEASR